MAQAVKRGGLDRRARVAVAAAGALLLAVPIFLVAKVALNNEGSMPGHAFRPDDGRLVMLRDGSTMFIKNSSSRRIADWFKLNRKGEERFEVGNANFTPGSPALTHDGWEHVIQFARMLESHSGVRAVILFSAHHGDSATVELERERADRIRQELRGQGVGDEQITIAPEAFEANHNSAADEGLEVVLTNRG